MKPSALTYYIYLRRAELMMQMACIAGGIPLQAFQRQFDHKIEQAWQKVQQERMETKAR